MARSVVTRDAQTQPLETKTCTSDTVFSSDTTQFARLRYPKTMSEIGTVFLQETLTRLRREKSIGDRALAQIPDEALHVQPNSESNSIAQIVKHLSGNMISRWTDFLTTDGEKPDRHRDAEFVDDDATRSIVLERWERGWACMLGAIGALTPDDLAKTITIRSEPISVIAAIQRQVTHVPYHIGQIVYLAKMFMGQSWTSLSIPRSQSEAFMQEMQGKHTND
jgi:uncharacterized damage-inducible protein DinB